MGLKPATLKTQISALSAFFNKPIADNPWVGRFIRAATWITPSRRDTTPPWDLSLVLDALTKPPFEPIQETSIKHLTLKTTFSSGCYISKTGRGTKRAGAHSPIYSNSGR